MFRPTIRYTQKQIIRRTARYCDSPWFRLAVVVLLICLLLPVPRVQAESLENNNAHGLQSAGVVQRFHSTLAVAPST